MIKTHWSLSGYGLAQEATELWQACRNNSWLTFLPQRRLWGCIIHQRCSHTGAAGWSAPNYLILNEWNIQAPQSLFAPHMPGVISANPSQSTQTHKLILTSESELSSSARLGAFRSLFLWGTDWDPAGSTLGDADPLVRDRVLDTLLPMYGLNSSAKSHTQERVIQTKGRKSLEMDLKTLPHIPCILCYALNLFWLFCPWQKGKQTVFKSQCVFLGSKVKRCSESYTEDWGLRSISRLKRSGRVS